MYRKIRDYMLCIIDRNSIQFEWTPSMSKIRIFFLKYLTVRYERDIIV